ncbi:hypothetical protein OG215_30015 [Streptomyces globisporus]|uniref:hypothetical protein n=1 Tax=Streptomyces globisporus TaxID=1908 RepID=UPI0038640A1C|nr:hypothetical protein OG215_30015 [Streptomyces globisporus]
MSSWRSWHRPLVVFSAAMAAFAIVSAVGLVVDDRVLVGAPIWAKPFKFSVSFVAYCLTLAWMLTLLTRGRRIGRWAGHVLVLTGLIEMVIITVQVVRGKRSHFNTTTAFDSALWNAMGMTIVVLWSATLVIAVLLLRTRITDRATALAVRGGLLIALAGAGLGFLMTLPSESQQAAAGLDAADTMGAHSVGVPDGGPSMPLTGWSTTGGDLRAPHFVGMHALQLIPLLLIALVLLAPRFTALRDAGVRLRLVRVAVCGYAALVALITWQALRGQPLIHPDGVTLAAAGTILAAVAYGTWRVLRPTAPDRPSRTAAEQEPVA